jgi:phosphoribosylformylglycinamidine cyclo-ligase
MPRMTYRRAGVDIDAADRFIGRIKPLVRTTGRPEVLGGIGGFSVLVSSTDGVGTKLLIADMVKKFDTVGVDLVAMSVDDVVVLGAEPLFFLDYIAVGKVVPSMLVDIVRGIVRGCREARCALVGGETAELPGLYGPGKWDLAGFCVGLVDEPKVIDGRTCRAGDAVIGLASSGLHSNGYSLARKVFSVREIRAGLWRELLRPTRIYCTAILEVLKTVRIKSMAHITGGGFYDNIPRVIPEGFGVRVEKGSWPVPAIFGKIQRAGRVDDREMYRTLNMGIGMALVVRPLDVDRTIAGFAKRGFKAWAIGEVVRGRHEVVLL